MSSRERHRTARLSTLICVLLALGAAVPSSTASAGAQGTCMFFNVKSQKAIDISGASMANGAPVIQWTFHGGENQFFAVDAIPGTPWYAIRNVNSAKVLDVANASTADGAPVIQWTLHGGPNQQWGLVFSGKIVVFVNVNSGKVLDVSGGSTENGAPLIQWTWHGGTNQIFYDGGECIPPPSGA